MALEARVPISAELSLAKPSDLPPDTNPRVRFSPLGEKAWLIEVLVRPGGGSSFVPGTGPEVVIDVRQPEPCLQKRDFDSEVYLAEKLVNSTPLNGLRGTGARFITESHDDILDCIKALNTLETPIEWPKSGVVPKVNEPTEDPKVSLTVSDKNLWFEASGNVIIGSEVISLKELIHALRKEKRFIELPSGAWMKISKELKLRGERILELLAEDSMDLSSSAALELLNLKESFEFKKSSDRFENLKKRVLSPLDLSLPESLNATLRPYQKLGFEWLQTLYQRGFGCCLADDMGLGKTLQTIAVILKNYSFGPTLVVSPVSLIHNWESELRRFAPRLRIKIWSGAERKDDALVTGNFDVLLTSYGTLQRDRDLLQKEFWNILVMDEAQNLKNPSTQNWKALSQITAKWKVALSGTPIENKLEELWAILSAACPGVLGGRDEFKRQFEIPIMKFQSEKARTKLKKRIAPFMLRRLKKDYLTELPPKIEKNLYAVPSFAEKNFYEACRLEALDRIQSQLQDPTQKEKLRFEVLASLQTLRQVACHPVLLNPEWHETSAKQDLFISTVKGILESDHKVLVFSQFTRFLTLMRNALDKENVTSFYLDGSTPLEERKSLVERFQKGSADVFFISLKAGGTGLNLTEADFVIHLDPWWNPAVENQASDRAWRMGQLKPVTVYRLVTEGSIEERILAMHAAKRSLSEDFTGSGDGNLEGLLELLSVSRPRPPERSPVSGLEF
jgi:SNF2 family DNA or RNA helicase